MLLRQFRQSVRALKGVGPVLERDLARLGIRSLSDLLLHYPREYQDRRELDRLAEADRRELANVRVEVTGQSWIGSGYRKTLKVEVRDESDRASLVCFGRAFLSGVLVPGQRFLVCGRFQRRGGRLQCTSFEYEPAAEDGVSAAGPGAEAGPDSRPGLTSFGRILPIYPLTDGLTQGTLRRLMAQALAQVGAGLDDELPGKMRERWGLLDKRRALQAIHFPESWEELEAARRTLAYEEMFYLQLILARGRARRQAAAKGRRAVPFTLRAELERRLPFRLTADQVRVLSEIEADLFAPHPGGRLLQGDVGSGKTLVAFLAALSVIEAGEQAAFLAPTELLARQHAENAARLLEPLGVRLAFLAGGLGGEPRRRLLAALAAGEVDLLIGTHALFSDDVTFRRLGLVIVDEQQRFGVRQRQAIMAKGERADLLLMTATPIPRTLCLALFGDLELSEIHALPPGRRPVITHLARQGNEGKVYEWVRREIERGRQAYFIYPLIEESEKLDLKSAEEMARRLREEVFPGVSVGLIHSRVPEERKREVMASFAKGETAILVATNVLEVGVDIANATCLVVEHAERFGLSALHQLRGRVGRGSEQSYAFFVYSPQLTEDGVSRLRTIMSVQDGFRIAEEDLRIRGPGEFLGFRQSGYLRLGLADPNREPAAWLEARRAAQELVGQDPGLLDPGHAVIRRVLAEAPPFPEELAVGS